MSTQNLQTSSNAFPATFNGYPAPVIPKKILPQPKNALQRIQESDGRNWLYYQLFLRQDFDACDVALQSTAEEEVPVSQSTYAIYMKGLIAKRQGKLPESLQFMKECHASDRRNIDVLKELISLSFLTRAYPEALAYVELAKELQPNQDWFTMHHQGLCYERLGDLSLAEEYLKSAINIQAQEKAYIALAEFYMRHGSVNKAGEVLDRAKKIFPESLALAARLGRLQIKSRHEDLNKGFGNLAQASSGMKTPDETVLLAVGSVMQRKVDLDGALKKYEAIMQDPRCRTSCPSVLNNIALCYVAKPRKTPAVPGKKDASKMGVEEEYTHRLLMAVGCLKKAQQLAPMDWKIAGNLGYLMRELKLFATASCYLMAAIRLAQKNPCMETYLILAGAADHLEISNQANQLYKHCVKNNVTSDPVVYLNYATFLLREGEKERATEMAIKCRDAIAEWELTARPVDTSIVEMFRLLKTQISLPASRSQIHPTKSNESTAGSLASRERLERSGSHELIVSAQVEKND